MRRTTICRSSRAVLLALVAGLLGVPGLGAQDTTRAAADSSQAPAAPAGQVPESHVVTRGETLWSISQLYFSDPLLWPEIYRLNTAVVEDPHWIYPGEVLHLAAPTSVARVSAETTAVAVGQPSAADTVRAQGADTAMRVDTTRVDTAQLLEAAPLPPGPPATDETSFARGRPPPAGGQGIRRAQAHHPPPPL